MIFGQRAVSGVYGPGIGIARGLDGERLRELVLFDYWVVENLEVLVFVGRGTAVSFLDQRRPSCWICVGVRVCERI